MKLYGYWRSSASYRIRIVLNVKGLHWDYVPVMLNRDEHEEAAYRALTPAGLVPVLDTGSERLGQSGAIAEYLEELHPQPPMLPADPLLRARIRELQGVIGSDVHPLQNLRVLKHLRSEFGQDDTGIAAWCRKWIGRGFAVYEALASERSADGRYSVGDSFTLADAWLMPQVYNAERHGLSLDAYPTIASIARHCSALPPVAAAHPASQPDAPSDPAP